MRLIQVFKTESVYPYLFWSLFLNGVGNRFAQVGSFALIYIITESGIALGALLALRVLPMILFAPIGGHLADRFHKLQLLFWIDRFRMPLALLPIVSVYTEQLWPLFLSTALIATGDALYNPARYSAIPDVVNRKNLVSINGFEQQVIGATLIFGSLLGGIVAFFTSTYVLFILHACFLFLASQTIGKAKDVSLPSRTLKESSNVSSQHLHLLTQVALLRGIAIVMLIMPLANGVDNVVMNLFALEVFSMGDLGVGIIYGSLGLGFFLSSYMAQILKGKFIFIAIIMIAFEGIFHILLSQSSFFAQAVALALCITFVGGISNICFDTILMKLLPTSSRGRLIGTLTMVQNSSMGIAMIGAGFLTEWLTPQQTALYVGLSYIGFATIFWLIFRTVNTRHSIRQLRKVS